MKSFIPLLFLLSLAYDASCEPAELRKLFGVPSNARRRELYQRKEAPSGAFPFYVSLRTIEGGQHFCAGTLISPLYILTSASCVDRGKADPTAEGIAADIGTHRLDRPENAENRTTAATRKGYIPEYGMRVKNVTVHEKYSNGTEGRPPYDARYDIAILKLEKRSRHRWALLPLEELDCCEGEDLLNVGLGGVESEAGVYAESLEMAVFPYLPYKKCKAYFRARPRDEFFGRGRKGNLTASASFCVSGAGGYCQLDEGSSLVRYRGPERDSVLVGFANDATQDCSYGAPYVFSSISSHIKWIIRLEGVLKDIASSTPAKFAHEGTTGDFDPSADLPELDLLLEPLPSIAPASAPAFAFEPASAPAFAFEPAFEPASAPAFAFEPAFEPASAPAFAFEPAFEPASAPRPPAAGIAAESIDAQPGRFPYAVSIRRTGFQHAHRCGGVLISARHVLTAASCLSDEAYSLPKEIIVYIGGIHVTPGLDSDDEKIRALEIISHPKHRAHRNTVDLAIIVLKKRSKKTPVRLPVQSRGCCESGTPMRIFGWRSQSMGSRFSGILQTGVTDYISRKQCVSDYGVQNLNRKAVCAGHRYFGAFLCGGDYSTPLLLTGGAEDILIGIGFASNDDHCGEVPSEFLRIAFFMRWIKQHLSNV